MIWPRSAISHRWAVSVVPQTSELMTSTAERMAPGFAGAKADLQVDGVLDDVPLAVEVGKDVDRRIGDEKDFGIAWVGDQKKHG